MSSGGPWSVKGIDPRARARAKTAARREGMTLGEWLNRVILDDGPEIDGDPRWESNLESYPGFTRRNDESDALLRGMVERLTERIDSTEKLSSEVINEVDRSLSELAERVETSDQSFREDTQKTRDLAEAARKAAEALALRVQRIEEAGGTADPQAMQAFESAFGKLAARVFRNEKHSLQSADTIHSALEEFGAATEQATLSLQQRIESIESGQARLAEDLRKSGDRGQNTSRALNGLHTAADRLRRRVEETERLSHDTASAFEESVARIDARLRAMETRPFSADTADIDRRFDVLSDELARIVADTRAEMARELENVVAEPRVERLERALKSAEKRIAVAETSHSESLSRIGLEITRLARVMDDRITESEKKAEALHTGDKAEREMDRRFEAVREENRAAVKQLGEDVARLGENLTDRIEKGEARTAEAFEAATRNMSDAVAKLEERQSAKSREDELDDRLRASEERTAKRIEDAISGISQRLEEARAETEESLSPVQRAMNALADRLEAIENRKAEAEAETAPAPTPKAAHDPALRQPAYDEPDFDTPLPPAPDAETPPGFDEDEVDDPFIVAEASTPASRSYAAPTRPDPVAEPDDDEFLIDEHALEDELAAAEDIAAAPQTPARGPSADAGMILQPMEPVDEPVQRQRPREEAAQARPRPRAPLGATADKDFLAAARSRTRGDRSVSYDPYANEDSGSGNGRMIMIAASVLGFIAIASAAGMLVYDNINRDPASTAQALSSDVLGGPDSSTPVTGIEANGAADESRPAETEELADNAAEAASPAQPPETGSSEPETQPAGTAHNNTAETRPDPAAGSAPREASLQPAASTTPAPAPERVTLRIPTLQEAAAAGDPVARYLLGEERLSEGNVAAAVALIRRAAEQNVPAAQYRYAKMLERGEGVEANATEARQWTRRAAEAGHRRAMHNLGVMFATGSGGEENIEQAFHWFEEAALRGLTDSQYNLAVLFQQGQGTEQSLADAYAWFSIAAAGGDSGAAQQAATIGASLDAGLRAQADSVADNFTPRAISAEANGQYDRNWGVEVTLDTDTIAAAQGLLNGLGYDAGPADGQWGPQTQAAIRSFQTDRGLPATGIIDDALIGRLTSARAG